ncbi:MAG: hypothetical protein JWQ87_5523 [Candidatus Sulfotelmatobacter sp.]|nr:hypothetical protein [Candidatus Sulfotelmatobacter sp.]
MPMPEQQGSSTEFTIVIEGPAVSRTYPLFGVSAILLNTTSILRDSAIDVIVPNLRTTGRVDIELDAEFPREGSYVQDIVLNVVEFVHQNVAPIILAIPIREIIKHANQTLELADRLRKFLHRERKLHVERVEEGTAIVAGDGKERLAIPQQSFRSLEATFGVFAELNQNRLKSVEIRASDGSQLKMEYESRERISPQEFKHLKATVRRLHKEAKHGGRAVLAAGNVAMLPPSDQPFVGLRGNVRELDFDSRTGRFRVFQGNPIPEGTYEFELLGEQSFTDIKGLLGETTVLMDCIVDKRGKTLRLSAVSVRGVGA